MSNTITANKVSNFSHLIHRVAANCLLHPLASTASDSSPYSSEAETGGEGVGVQEDPKKHDAKDEELMEMETLVNRVFDAVSVMKGAYVTLQDAHSPWDPDSMRIADSAVVAELRTLANLREEFSRRKRSGRNESVGNEANLARHVVVAPYEAALDELKRDVKARDAEIENLREKVRSLSVIDSGGVGKKQRRSGMMSRRRLVSFTQLSQVGGAATPEMFMMTMRQVKKALKSFTSILLSLIKSAQWDTSAAVRSIEAAFTDDTSSLVCVDSIIGKAHTKYALESYISRKIFHGFDHEAFYMDGSLSSLINPDQFRKECFTQFLDMKAMDPVELLGILPTCKFGTFCSKKYLSIVHPKMEESLFGNMEHHKQISDGNHPRSLFFGEFLAIAKTVWLLHLLAFSLDPKPSQFDATRGAEFHHRYMENVLKNPDGRVTAGQIVAFPVSPGFKLGNNFVIKARVYLALQT